MEIIKLDRVVSVSSEIQGHPAQNILDGEIRPNKNWMCEKGTDKAVVLLQLERAAVLTSIHIGNAHSAFVEVLVGRAADISDQFESLIPMSTFMSLNESKTGNNPNRTRFFNKEDFNESARDKSWDRIKIVCSQPFNKHVPYGLCFFKVHGEKDKKMEIAMKGVEEDEIQIGSFFKKKRTSDGDKPLSVSEQIKQAETSPSKHTPLNISKISERMKKSEKKPKKPPEKHELDKQSEKRTKKNDEEDTSKKRKLDLTPEIEKKKEISKPKKKPKKPFGKLLEDVVLVISGFKNPLRGNIRSMALEMGAKYSPDWESHCTHLICAYDNTPKFNQVKGKGKIVKKDWVEKCHSDKKRYPWRRFALGKSDLKKDESEEEIDAGEDTEPELEEGCGGESSSSKIKTSTKAGSETKCSGSDEYNVPTDDDDEKSHVDTTDYPMPFLSNMFSSKTFYLDPDLKNKHILERYIIAYNGIITEEFNEDVVFYITDKEKTPIELFRKKAPKVLAVKPSWIWEANSKQEYIPVSPHLVK